MARAPHKRRESTPPHPPSGSKRMRNLPPWIHRNRYPRPRPTIPPRRYSSNLRTLPGHHKVLSDSIPQRNPLPRNPRSIRLPNKLQRGTSHTHVQTWRNRHSRSSRHSRTPRTKRSGRRPHGSMELLALSKKKPAPGHLHLSVPSVSSTYQPDRKHRLSPTNPSTEHNSV